MEASVQTPERPAQTLDIVRITASPIIARSSDARRAFDISLALKPKAMMIDGYVSGMVPDSFYPLIRESVDLGVSVFVLSTNYANTEGAIQEVKYESQEAMIKSGAVPIRDVNTNKFEEVRLAIQAGIDRGLRGMELDKAIAEQFGTLPEVMSRFKS